MTDEPILLMDNATKIYDAPGSAVRALDSVTAQVRAGQVLAIFGPSGSGKTTFLMIAGLIDVPTQGGVVFHGKTIATPETELNELRAFRRQHIGFVFQRANLIPFLTAVENVQVAMHLNDVPQKEAVPRAWSLLEKLDVGHRGNSLPQQLSGGEQQRVAIARALANKPCLIFADEPTGALDSLRGRQVMELFRELADTERVAVCVVTHDPRSIDLFDRIIEMSDGAIRTEYARLSSGRTFKSEVDPHSLLGPLFKSDNWEAKMPERRRI
jgi:putative ABC transport system ATP-binding protein